MLNIEKLNELAHIAIVGGKGVDQVMLLENAGAPVAGESVRPYPDGKPRLDILGWSWGQTVAAIGAGADGSRHYTPLYVVRQADAACGSIASLVYNRTRQVSATIENYRAGGDTSSPVTQSMFEFKVEEAQVTEQYFLTHPASGWLLEMLVFSYRKATVRSASQQRTGARGAVRECTITLTGDA